MNKEINFILRTIVMLMMLAAAIWITVNVADAMLTSGINPLIAVLPMASVMFGIGCWFIE